LPSAQAAGRHGCRFPQVRQHRIRTGAGKTTTIRLLLGFIRPTAGRAEIFGVDCQRDPGIVHRRVAFVPAEASLWPSLTGAETLLTE
jgi:ABC-type multidrug transport system ATPase subunit